MILSAASTAAHAQMPIWQVVIQLVSPAVALAIAVWAVWREGARRRAERTERILTRARCVVWEVVTGTASGSTTHADSADYTIRNLGDRPIMSLEFGEPRLPAGIPKVGWHPLDAPHTAVALPPGGTVTWRGLWLTEGDEFLSPQTKRAAAPQLTWSDSDGARLELTVHGMPRIVE